MKYTGHLRRHTAKKCPQRIKDTPAVLFYRIPCTYTVYFKRRWRDGFTKPLLKILNVEGHLPPKALSMVREWMSIHQKTLLHIWETQEFKSKLLFTKWAAFKRLENEPELFNDVAVDTGGYGMVWNDELDLSCDELYENGKTIKTPFGGLIAMSDATLLWGLHESTLRKAIAYGKLVNGIDACKYGKQWVISAEAMKRECGQPVN